MGTSSRTTENPSIAHICTTDGLMTAIALGLMSFEEVAVSLLEKWWAEMSVNS